GERGARGSLLAVRAPGRPLRRLRALHGRGDCGGHCEILPRIEAPRNRVSGGPTWSGCDYLLTTSWLSSFITSAQAWSAFFFLESISWTDGPNTCDWMTESSGPLYWATTPFARSARILPTGALLKNFVRSLSPVTPGSDCA